MKYTLTYDQIPEESDTFLTMGDVVDFARSSLNGHYEGEMRYSEFKAELTKNGYYLAISPND